MMKFGKGESKKKDEKKRSSANESSSGGSSSSQYSVGDLATIISSAAIGTALSEGLSESRVRKANSSLGNIDLGNAMGLMEFIDEASVAKYESNGNNYSNSSSKKDKKDKRLDKSKQSSQSSASLVSKSESNISLSSIGTTSSSSFHDSTDSIKSTSSQESIPQSKSGRSSLSEKEISPPTKRKQSRTSTFRSFFGDSSGGAETENEAEVMHQLFPDLPSTEALLLHHHGKQGRYFITTNFICFHPTDANPSSIPFRDILSIQKRKSSNSVEFVTVKGPIFLHNFSNTVFKQVDAIFKANFAENAVSLNRALKNEDFPRVIALVENAGRFGIQFDQMDEDGSYPLHSAIRTGNPTIVKLFLQHYLKHNMDINSKDRLGWTIAHCAAAPERKGAAEDEILKEVLEYPSIIIDVSSVDGNTPLHYFCQKFLSVSCQELGAMFFKKGAIVNKKNRNGETPLHKAIMNPAVRVLMLELLIDNGADVNIPTTAGETALSYAVHLGRKDIIKILLQAGADYNVKLGKDHKTALELAQDRKQEKIAEAIKRAEELREWLASIQMEQFYRVFLKEELYLDILIETDDVEAAIEGLKLNLTMGSRLTLKKAIANLKEAHQKKQPADLKARLAVVKNQSKTNAVNALQQVKRGERMKASIGTSWEINHSDLEFTKKLGSGTSGKVYKGLYKGKKVAIKVLKAEDLAVEEEFKKEFKVLSVINAPHIVQFLGACIEPKLCMVMEYCGKGSLYHVLSDKDLIIDWGFGLKFAIEITSGLNVLHTWEPPILHRDMKSLNVLVTDDWEVKLTDFGLARFNTADNMQTLSHMVGTVGWSAPELLSGSYTKKSDVYSLAIIFWEIVVRVMKGRYEQPYKDQKLNDLQIMVLTLENHMRPTIPANCPKKLADLIVRCWDPLPEKRPDCEEIEDALDDIIRDFQANTEDWDELLP